MQLKKCNENVIKRQILEISNKKELRKIFLKNVAFATENRFCWYIINTIVHYMLKEIKEEMQKWKSLKGMEEL